MNKILSLLALLALAGCVHATAPVPNAVPNDAEMRAHELSLSTGPSGDYAAWHGGYGMGSAIYVQALDAQGRLTGAPLPVSDGAQLAYEPDLIQADGRLIVAWYERNRESGRLSAWLAAIDRAGKRQWIAPLKATEGSSRNPVVRQIGNALHVAWIEQAATRGGGNEATIWHQRLSLAGKPLGAPRQVGEANRDTWNLNAGVTGDSLVLAYDAALGTRAHELHMLLVGAQGLVHRRLSPDDGHASLYPDLQLSAAGNAAVTWFDEKDGNREVYLLTAPLTSLAEGVVPASIRVTVNEGESIGAYLAWHGETIGLVWSNETGATSQIFGQLFDAHGRPLGPARPLSATAETSSVPAIRARGAGFLVAWNDYVIAGTGSHMNVTSSRPHVAEMTLDAPAP